jgi:hypothetical protein
MEEEFSISSLMVSDTESRTFTLSLSERCHTSSDAATEMERRHFTNILCNRIAREYGLEISWVGLQSTRRCIACNKNALYPDRQAQE